MEDPNISNNPLKPNYNNRFEFLDLYWSINDARLLTNIPTFISENESDLCRVRDRCTNLNGFRNERTPHRTVIVVTMMIAMMAGDSDSNQIYSKRIVLYAFRLCVCFGESRDLWNNRKYQNVYTSLSDHFLFTILPFLKSVCVCVLMRFTLWFNEKSHN